MFFVPFMPFLFRLLESHRSTGISRRGPESRFSNLRHHLIRRLGRKPTMLEKMKRRLRHIAAVHDEGVRAPDDTEIGHPFDLRPSDADLAIGLSREDPA